jgi:hypothetical protein
MQNFAFVHGPSKSGNYQTMARRMFTSSLSLPLVDQKKLDGRRIRTLHDCIQYLTTSSEVTGPIGDLFLMSHASSSHLAMPMFAAQKKATTEYEILLQTWVEGIVWVCRSM